MQLKDVIAGRKRAQDAGGNQRGNTNIAQLINVAACSVLAASSAAVSAESIESAEGTKKAAQQKTNESASRLNAFLQRDWTAQAAVLHYSEDGRITVNQGLLKLKGAKDKSELQLNLGYDVVTGPSESGAVPTPEAQTFTSPSGATSYQVEAGDLPWYEIVRHPRKEISLSGSRVVNPLYSVSYGLRYSTETTYISRSVNAGFVRDANKNNTQYSLAFSYEDADVSPYGGAVVPRTRVLNREDFATEAGFNAAWNAQRVERDKDKDVLGLIAGVTQVINRDALVQINYSYGESRGYQNDAQKIVSVINDEGLPLYHLHENRPHQRVRQSLFGNTKYSLSENTTLGVQYRYYWDDWSVRSHTLSLGYQFELSERIKIEPQIRWYDQSSARFFRHSVFAEPDGGADGSAIVPQYLSADYRLAATTNYTLGINLDYYPSGGDVISVRLAHYDINPEQDSRYTRGYLDAVRVLPSISATVLAFSYEFQ